MPDKCHRLSLADGEIDITQHPLFGIAEGNVFQTNSLVEDQGLGLGRVSDRALGTEDAVDTLHRSHTSADGISPLTQVLQRIDEAVEDDQIVDEGRGIDAAITVEDERTAIPQHDRNSSCAQELTHGVRQELTAVHADDRPTILFVGRAETLIDKLLRSEGLDDT